MKSVIWLSTLLFLISGCTIVGLVSDVNSNDRRQKQSDSIQKIRQEIVLQKTDGEVIEAVYMDFGYISDTAECAELSAEKTFPQIGDPISLTLKNGNNEQGIFAGMIHSFEHFELILRQDWSTVKLKYYKMDRISLIRGIESDLLLEKPEAGQITVHYDVENTSGCIPLSDLSYLNKQVVKKRYVGTIVGFSIDAAVLTITAINVSNSLSDSFDW